MKILLHTMATPDLDPVGAMDLAKALNFDGLDLICQSGYQCGIDPLAPKEQAERLAKAAAERKIPIRAFSPYCKAINDTDAAVREQAVADFKRAIDQASALSASSLRVLVGNEVRNDTWEQSVEIAVASLRTLAEYATPLGVSLNIENHDGSLADDAARTMQIWEAVNHPSVGIIYDPANLIRDGKEAFPESFDIQAAGVKVIHVKDYFFSPDYPNGRRAMPIGDGVIDWREMLEHAHKSGFSGDLSIEYETRWVPEQLPAPAEGLGRSLEHLDMIMSDLGIQR